MWGYIWPEIPEYEGGHISGGGMEERRGERMKRGRMGKGKGI